MRKQAALLLMLAILVSGKNIYEYDGATKRTILQVPVVEVPEVIPTPRKQLSPRNSHIEIRTEVCDENGCDFWE